MVESTIKEIDANLFKQLEAFVGESHIILAYIVYLQCTLEIKNTFYFISQCDGNNSIIEKLWNVIYHCKEQI